MIWLLAIILLLSALNFLLGITMGIVVVRTNERLLQLAREKSARRPPVE